MGDGDGSAPVDAHPFS